MGTQDKHGFSSLEVERSRSKQAATELERDVAVNVALNEADRRVAAQNAAANERIRADEADFAARASSASAQAARNEAAGERAAAGNASFAAVLIAILAAGVIAALAYVIWWQPTHVVETPTNTIIQRTEKTTTSTAPPTVNVSPPRVNVNVENPTPPIKSDDQTGADDNTSQSGNQNSSSSIPGSGGD